MRKSCKKKKKEEKGAVMHVLVDGKLMEQMEKGGEGVGRSKASALGFAFGRMTRGWRF